MAINVLDGQQRAIKWPSKWPQWPSVAKSVPIAHLLQHRDVRLERLDARAEVVILGLHSTGGRARLGKQLGAELELRSNGLPDEGGNRTSSEVIRSHQKSSELELRGNGLPAAAHERRARERPTREARRA